MIIFPAGYVQNCVLASLAHSAMLKNTVTDTSMISSSSLVFEAHLHGRICSSSY